MLLGGRCVGHGQIPVPSFRVGRSNLASRPTSTRPTSAISDRDMWFLMETTHKRFTEMTGEDKGFGDWRVATSTDPWAAWNTNRDEPNDSTGES